MRNVFLLLYTLVAAFLLTGCLDVIEAIGIHKDGGGEVSTAIRGDNELMTREQLSTLDPLLEGPGRTEKIEVVGGIPLRVEAVKFEEIGEVSSAIGPYTLEVNADGTTTLTHTVLGEEEYDSELDSMGVYFRDRQYIYSVQVPGKITDTPSLTVLGRTYEAERDGYEVSWTLPMDQFVKAINMGKNLTFSVTYQTP